MVTSEKSVADKVLIFTKSDHFTSTIAGVAIALIFSCDVSAALTVSGTVQDQDGVAAGGALVTFINEADESQRISTVTDDAGRYELDLSNIGAIPTLVSMSEASETPTESQLFQNYPNPFNPETIIPYHIARSSYVSLDIYNSLGQRVRTLVNEYQAAGIHKVQWDATDNTGWGVGAGVYLYQLRSTDFSQTGKMLLVDGNKAFAPSSNFVSSGSFANAAGKLLAVPTLFTITITGEGFFDYIRTGVAISSDTVVDILVNSAVDSGILRLSLTDAPVDGADAVRLTLSSVAIRREGDGPWETFAGERTFDLLALSGISELLGEEVLPAGPVKGIRLIVADAEIDIDGGTFPIEVPSGEQSGLKLKGDFEIVPGEILDLTIDFDARKSIVRRGQGNDFLLKPVVRLIQTGDAGAISGRVEVEEGVFLERIKVVVIVLQDGEEISSAKVDPVDGTYRIAFLPAGSYDLILESEGLTIEPESIDGISVIAGEETENANFTITASLGEEEEGDEAEGEAITLDNVADVWGRALVAISRLQGEVTTPGEATIAGEIEGEANITLEVDALAGTVTHIITFAAFSDDGELTISGELTIVATSGSEELAYTGTLDFGGVYTGEVSVDMSGTVDGTSGTLGVGGEELVVE